MKPETRRNSQKSKCADFYSDHDLDSDGVPLTDKEPTVGKLVETLNLDQPVAKGKDYIITEKSGFHQIQFLGHVAAKRRNKVRDDWIKSNLKLSLVDGYVDHKGDFIKNHFVVACSLSPDTVVENLNKVCGPKNILVTSDTAKLKQCQVSSNDGASLGTFSVYKKVDGSKIMVQAQDVKISAALEIIPRILSDETSTSKIESSLQIGNDEGLGVYPGNITSDGASGETNSAKVISPPSSNTSPSDGKLDDLTEPASPTDNIDRKLDDEHTETASPTDEMETKETFKTESSQPAMSSTDNPYNNTSVPDSPRACNTNVEIPSNHSTDVSTLDKPDESVDPPPISEQLPAPDMSDNEDVWHDADSDQPNTSEAEQTKRKGFSTPKHKVKKKRKSGKVKTPGSQYNYEGPIKLLESAVLKLQLKDEQKSSENEKQDKASQMEARLLDAIDKKLSSTSDLETRILQAIEDKLSYGMESRLLNVIDEKIKESIEEKIALMNDQVNRASDDIRTELSGKLTRGLNEVNIELRRITNIISSESLRKQSPSEFDPLRSRVFNIENKVNVLVDTLKALLRLNELNGAAENMNVPVTQKHVSVGTDTVNDGFLLAMTQTTESHANDNTSKTAHIFLPGNISKTAENHNEIPTSENLSHTSTHSNSHSSQQTNRTEAGSTSASETPTSAHIGDDDETASVHSLQNENLKNRQDASMMASSPEQETESILDPSLVVHSEKVIYGGSAFQAHLYTCQESDISQIHEEIAASFGKEARHNILLYNGEEMLADNDGEHNADSKLAELFLSRSKKEDLVIITRWYDGKHIGPVRWRIMKNVMREVLEKRDAPKAGTPQSAAGLHKVQLPNKGAGIHKVQIPERRDAQRLDDNRSSLLLLADSTVDKQKSTKGTLVSNYRAPTLRHCITAVSYPKLPRNQIVTGVGANDVDKLSVSEFKEQLGEFGDKLHENYPSTRVYMMAIPPGTDEDRNIVVCQFNKAMEVFCREHRFTFLDTYLMLEYKCADRKHPNEDGRLLITKVISSCIQGNALGMIKKLTDDELRSRQTSYADALRSGPGSNNQHIETIITQGISQDARRSHTSSNTQAQKTQTLSSQMYGSPASSYPPQTQQQIPAHSYPPQPQQQVPPHIPLRQHNQNQTATQVVNSTQASLHHQPQSQTPGGFEGTFQPQAVPMHYNNTHKAHMVYGGMQQFHVPTHAPLHVLPPTNEQLWNSPDYHGHWENDYLD